MKKFLQSIGRLSLVIAFFMGIASLFYTGRKPEPPSLSQMFRAPVRFEANLGQSDPSVEFLSKGLWYEIFFTKDNIAFTFKNHPKFLSMHFVESNDSPAISAIDQAPSYSNYLIGNDASKWLTNVPHYSKVSYENIYNGINAIFYGNPDKFEYDITVAPHIDPSVVRLQIDGAETLTLDSEGALHVSTSPEVELVMQKPFVYQVIDGKTLTVESSYNLLAKNEIAFNIGHYNPAYPLIIDPVLGYSSYLGGSGNDGGLGIAVDSSGNAYVTGDTQSTNFPTKNPFQGALAGLTNAFVTKFAPDGASLVYSTYLGGNGSDQGQSIAVDTSGFAYITGYTTSTNFPLNVATQGSLAGTQNAFVTVLLPPGSGLVFSTYLGGNGTDVGNGIALDSSGNIYVTGNTSSTNFPTTLGAFETTYPGGSQSIFVTKYTPVPVPSYSYSTYVGGNNDSASFAIALDSTRNAYISGYTKAHNYPLVNAYQSSFSGAQTAIITVLNPLGQSLVYSTFLGSVTAGSDASQAQGIFVDSTAHAYVTGNTTDPNFPVSAGAFQSTLAGSGNAFITKFVPAGNAIVYSTYVGGNNFDFGNSITVDSSGCAYITGLTTSTNFPTTPTALQTFLPGTIGIFLTKLSQDATHVFYSTYFGGSAHQSGLSLAIDPNSAIYMTGNTTSSDFPVTAGAFSTTYGGSGDAFVSKFNIQTPVVLSITPNEGPTAGGTTVTITGTHFTGVTSVKFGATSASFVFVDDNQIVATSPPGVSTVHVTVITPFGTSTATSADLFTYIGPPFITSISPNAGPANGGTSVTITGGNFTAATNVHFGANGAVFAVDDDSHITATSPAGTGTVDVTVTTPFGTSTIVPADQFSYFGPPTITSVVPNSGPSTGGTTVTITGTHFTNASVVHFGAAAALFTVDDDSHITAVSPPGIGTVDITVTTPSGTSAIVPADQFTYLVSPILTGISPTSGPVGGGTGVTITGSGFTGTTSIKFGSQTAAFNVVSDTQINAVSPPSVGLIPGSVEVTVVTPAGNSPYTPAGVFTYLPNMPIITALIPNSGPVEGGNNVIIQGSNFVLTTSVYFGTSAALSFVVESDQQISAVAPQGTGVVNVSVANPWGTSNPSAASEYTYLSIYAPTSFKGLSKTKKYATQYDVIVILSWVPPTKGSPPKWYKIYRNAQLTDLITTVPASGDPSYQDNGLARGKTYTYYLVAVDANGNTSPPVSTTVKTAK